MTKILIILLLITINPSFAKNKNEFKVKATENSQGKACNIAFGKYRRELKSRCGKVKKKVNYEKLVVSKCFQTKISDNKYKASYTIIFACK